VYYASRLSLLDFKAIWVVFFFFAEFWYVCRAPEDDMVGIKMAWNVLQ
jgi:hypothetical protein